MGCTVQNWHGSHLGHVTSIPYCSHITHLGPIWYHDLGSVWAPDGLYGINVGFMSLGPDIAHTKSTCPIWCPYGVYGAKPTRVPFGPCNVNPILFPHNPSGPIWYHDLGSVWAQDGLYGINVGFMSHGPDIAHTKPFCPMWCPYGVYGAKPTWVPFGPSHIVPT